MASDILRFAAEFRQKGSSRYIRGACGVFGTDGGFTRPRSQVARPWPRVVRMGGGFAANRMKDRGTFLQLALNQRSSIHSLDYDSVSPHSGWAAHLHQGQ